jgi:pSer/pThr/pTyr-binding forkhead associated (FHA) protein
VIELERGAGAFGALTLYNQLSTLKARRGVSLLTSRVWNAPQRPQKQYESEPALEPQKQSRPTHLLYRSIAYPISDRPLFIGKGDTADGITVKIFGQLAGVSRKHCSVELRNNEVILTDLSTYGTYVDEKKISESRPVQLGQSIRVGTPGEKLSLIACIDKK